MASMSLLSNTEIGGIMHENYEDIKKLTPEPPQWYDENGVPRYAPFEPKYCPDIYSHNVGLLLIACQACGQQFRVEMHTSIFGSKTGHHPHKWHYGDPPIHGCMGDTMNCDDLAVLEFWHREGIGEWERMKELEGVIDERDI
jgi:hypothetical protein